MAPAVRRSNAPPPRSPEAIELKQIHREEGGGQPAHVPTTVVLAEWDVDAAFDDYFSFPCIGNACDILSPLLTTATSVSASATIAELGYHGYSGYGGYGGGGR